MNGIIFDADGTILDSMRIWDNAGALYLKTLEKEAEPNLGTILFDMSMSQGAMYLKEKYDLKLSVDAIISGINDTIFKFYEKDVQLKTGVREFLDEAYGKKIPMTVATSSDMVVIEAAFKRLDIWKYFKKVFTASEVGVGKDRPDIYVIAMESMKTTPENTWVIDDGLYVLRTAKELGINTVGIYDDSSKNVQNEIMELSDIYIKGWNEKSKLNKLLL